MKKVFVLVVALLTAASVASAAGGKIAYIDTQVVFDKTKLGKKYQGVLKEYFESRKKILDLDADEIQKLRDDYQKQSAVLKPEARKENEELSTEFNQEMMTILKDMAKKEKISLVLNRTISVAQKGEIPAVLYGDEDLDLTEKIIAEMDKKFDAKK
jgi:Skp family chaperone for outer membrane proteins